MERKPWQDKGPRRTFDGEDGGERRGRFDRFDRFDRSDRTDRFDRSDRRDFGENRGYGDRPRRDFGDRPRYDRDGQRDFGGERRGFGGDRPRRDFGDRPRYDRKPGGRYDGQRQEYGPRSGPRARAYDTRRFAERSEFARNAIVKIDSDIADFFGSPEAVNKALRLLIDAACTVKFPAPAAIEPETAAQALGEAAADEDDVEDFSYGEAADDEDVPAADDADDAEDDAEDEPEAK